MQTDSKLGSVFYYPRPNNFLYAQITKSVSCYFFNAKERNSFGNNFMKKVRKDVTLSRDKYSVAKRSAAATEKVYTVIQLCEHCVYTATNVLHCMCAF